MQHVEVNLKLEAAVGASWTLDLAGPSLHWMWVSGGFRQLTQPTEVISHLIDKRLDLVNGPVWGYVLNFLFHGCVAEGLKAVNSCKEILSLDTNLVSFEQTNLRAALFPELP